MAHWLGGGPLASGPHYPRWGRPSRGLWPERGKVPGAGAPLGLGRSSTLDVAGQPQLCFRGLKPGPG